jgi:hypothetical protein
LFADKGFKNESLKIGKLQNNYENRPKKKEEVNKILPPVTKTNCL